MKCFSLKGNCYTTRGRHIPDAIPEESLLSITFIPQAETARQTEAAAWEALLLSLECEDLLGVGRVAQSRRSRNCLLSHRSWETVPYKTHPQEHKSEKRKWGSRKASNISSCQHMCVCVGEWVRVINRKSCAQDRLLLPTAN